MDVFEELERVHNHWFGSNPARGVPDEKITRWFNGDERTDQRLDDEFGGLHRIVTGDDVYPELVSDLENRRRKVGLILLLDQLSRHLFRGKPDAFAQDERARELASEMVRSGADRGLSIWERAFVYLPFEHSENPEDQRRSVDLFEGLLKDCPERWQEYVKDFLDYARRHRDVIREYGRFPHRNEVLGRDSSEREKQYLDEPGSGF